jgi:predicted nucleotidyltransferase
LEIEMPTALELNPKEWQRYIDAARRRPPLPELSVPEKVLREQRLERVHRAARQLKKQFGVEKVILFGSLVGASQFLPGSDVDLAVVGLRSEDYFEAWRVVEAMMEDCMVDLVEFEQVTDSLQQAILKYGVEV